MKILVRLPNWLGDMVMSIGFVNALRDLYPDAEISVIAKKGIDSLVEFFPGVAHRFVFSKDEYRGLSGAWRFGRQIRKKQKFDLFFCLPESFSSALIGFAAGAKKRIGYGHEMRNILLTKSYSKVKGLHRVEEYINLLEQFTNQPIPKQEIRFRRTSIIKSEDIIVNIHSEASSRRLPVQKAVSLLRALQQKTSSKILLIGGPKDKQHAEDVFRQLPAASNLVNLTGQTSLKELVALMSACKVVLSTDSGPAHLANAAGAYTVVLFGAGNENNTAPYNKANRQIIRLGQLPCEPCTKNVCVLYGIPKCLENLDEQLIVQATVKAFES